ncbi:MAG TPA: methyltransferase domain-containing protein [Cytophagaceae bacterium]|nr:methyltransferase domain-containing protein [Cytophagaceae bacterium]
MTPFTRIHKNLVQAIVQTLNEIFVNQRYADKAIEYTLQSNKKWGSRDRAFIAENTYEIVRWWRLITEIGNIKELDQKGLWNVFGTWWAYDGNDLPDWEEFKNINIPELQKRYEKLKSIRKINESIPDWLDDIGSSELPDRWEKELYALNLPAEVVLRVNTIKITRDKLFHVLHEEGIETRKEEEYPEALVLLKRQNIFSSPSFKAGLFEVQDASSQLVASNLSVEPGMRVVDACAGAGGKSLHLAALMKNKGRIIAMDTEAWKLENLKKRAARAGVSIIETRLIESSKTIKRMYESADRLLLDVPCSGLGVMRRNPDTKWKLTEAFLTNIKKTQKDILESYSPMLKKEGQMIYSTCSLLPSENNAQVKQFLSSQKEAFEMLSEKNIFPSESKFDGFYIARFKKK